MGRQKPHSSVRQGSLLEGRESHFPSTRYQGSKAKLVPWILDKISHLDFSTCLDAFGGTGAVGYHLKRLGKQVHYNDLLKFNYFCGLALIENSSERLFRDDIDHIIGTRPGSAYPSFVADRFKDIYFTDEENVWIDRTITNIRSIGDVYKQATAFFALAQSCIVKRPYNLFHRKNLYIRLAEVERSFGNKATWDKSFDHWFRAFLAEADAAVFDNGLPNKALNLNALDIPGSYDLVYIDTPYISGKGVAVDYLDFYHFLEGLALYDEWESRIDMGSPHRRFKRIPNEWSDRKTIHQGFMNLFDRFRHSILVISYRSDGIPSASELTTMLKRVKTRVQLYEYGRYKYVLSTNAASKEILLVADE